MSIQSKIDKIQQSIDLIKHKLHQFYPYYTISNIKQQNNNKPSCIFVESFKLQHPSSKIFDICWKDNRLISVDNKGNIFLWRENSLEFSWRIDDAQLLSCSSSAQLLAVSSLSGDISVFDTEKRRKDSISTFQAHSDYISCVEFIGGSMLASVSGDKFLKVYDLSSSKPVFVKQAHTQDIMSVAPSDVNPFILSTASCDNSLKMWDIRQTEPVFVYASYNADVNDVKFLPGSECTLLSACADSSVKLLDSRSFRYLGLYSCRSSIQSLETSKSGRLFMIGTDDGGVEIWDLENEKGPLQEIPGHSDKVSGVSLNERGDLLASSGFDGDLVVWAGRT